MLDRILIVTPTKQRLDNFVLMADSWVAKTSGLSDMVVGIDSDDPTYNSIFHQYPFTWERVSPKPFLHILNELALKYCDQYRWIGFMEDDCTYITTGWEKPFIAKLHELGDNGIVWGNDLLNEDSLVGLPVISSSLIKRLGFMAPPCLKCLWADNFWKQLGTDLNSLHYFDEIIIEHRHYSTQKSSLDGVTLEIREHIADDGRAYKTYIETQYPLDLARIR